MSPRLRILCLCGYTQNMYVFGGRLGALRKALADTAEMVFIDPTHVIDVPTEGSADFDSNAVAGSTDPKTTARAWWTTETRDDGTTKILGFEETLVYLRKVLIEQGPFDGVLGFSQGGALGGYLTALLERPTLDPIFSAPPSSFNESWPHPPFKFSILVSGLIPADPAMSAYYSEKLDTPSMHIIGSGDTIITPERSILLASKFATAVIENHEGGHFVPSKANFRPIFKKYVENFREEDLTPLVEVVAGKL